MFFKRSLEIFGLLSAYTLALRPILSTPYWNDDESNSMRAAILKFLGEGPFRHAMDLANQWRVNEGRFFPISAIENAYVFSFFTSRESYKIFQVFMLVAVGFAVALITWEVFRNISAAFISSVLFLSCVQIRNWFDPTIGFGVLLPSVSFKILLSMWLTLKALRTTIRTRRVFFWFSSQFFWALAVFQYEITVLVWPIILLFLVIETSASLRRRIVVGLSTAIPTGVAVLLAAIFRSQVQPSSAYQASITGISFWQTLGLQILAGVPGASSVFLDQDAWNQRSFVVAALTAGLIGYWSFKWLPDVSLTCKRLNSYPLILGLGFLTLPPIAVAISQRWQSELSIGYGYLPVFLQFIGFSFILFTLLSRLNFYLEKVHLVRRIISIVVMSLLIGTVSGVHAAGIDDVVGQLRPFVSRRELFEDSVRSGLFSEIPDGASVMSSSYSHNSWFNPWYYQWLGGSKRHQLAGIEGDLATSCKSVTEYEQCRTSGPWWGFVELIVDEQYTVNVIGQYKQLESDFMASSLVATSVIISTHHRRFLPEECRTDLQKTKYGNWIASCNSRIDSFANLQALLVDLD